MKHRQSVSFKRRAPIACTECHRRKIRCDAAVRGGLPCTNCRLDCKSCITRPDAIRKVRRSLSPLSNDKGGIAVGDSFGTFDSNKYDTEPTYKISFTPSPKVPYEQYSFLSARGLNSLRFEEQSFLESSGCLHLFEKDLLDAFVRAYFLSVHPTLPLVDSKEFCDIYFSRRRQPSRTISLLLFRTLLFAAAEFVPVDVLRECGFSSFLSARDILHSYAKLVYDFHVETDPCIIGQSALLLSYHASSSDQLSNTMWLSIAIAHARADDCHEYHCLPSSDAATKNRRKRLWWCCILRDRNLSMGLRRPLQISSYDFNFSQPCLTKEDFEAEINDPMFYSSDIRTEQCEMLTKYCHLAVALTRLAMIIYPSAGLSQYRFDSRTRLAEHLRDLYDAKLAFDRLKEGFMLLQDWTPASVDSNHSVRVASALLYIYYQSARVAICNHICFILQRCEYHTGEEEINLLHTCKVDLEVAVSHISAEVERLSVNGSAKYLPINSVAYIIVPQILLSLNTRLPTTSHEKVESERSLSYFMDVGCLYRVRYDTRHITTCIEKVLHTFELYQLQHQKKDLTTIAEKETSLQSFCDVFIHQPDTYVYISAILDYSLATGKMPTGDDSPIPYVKELKSPSNPSKVESTPLPNYEAEAQECVSLEEIMTSFDFENSTEHDGTDSFRAWSDHDFLKHFEMTSAINMLDGIGFLGE